MRITSFSLITLLSLGSCNDRTQSGPVIFNPTFNKPDTAIPIITSSILHTTYPPIFGAAFFNDTKVKEGDFSFEFSNYNIGKMRVESGKIIACDPIVMHDGIPFTHVFPKGEFPVQLAMAKTHNDERVAFSRIVFSDRPVAKWEFALQKDQKAIPLKDTIFYCYGVDAGTGMFIDSIANKYFNEKDHSEWKYVFLTKAEKNGYKGYTHEFEGHNLATFSTGYGDGCYATYIGFDSSGNACQLLTDFGLIGWWKLEEKK